ncbi:energy-coupling factor ABC transporter permease [Azohydromonas sediminis]|uniref:energy-coupling factor ABC transporter permease n=1 Tax=Azohydromonas sediminis TaxID=2259674 RepID=UPI000E65B553|nr:energy-coupling factor ABC transporter permease [Azohydromonas sediminis]
MHMADALLSPAVGAAMWLASGTALAFASRRLRVGRDDVLVPLMGLLGAFVFAAQMINFVIPGTGSSGHLGGALLLAILLGPHAALVVVASVLTVQALFFADGGLLALGANVFNLGVLPCYVAYPLVYRPLAGVSPTPRRLTLAALAAGIVGFQLGALGVVLQTTASGISSLPLRPFLALMLPIHLAIGVAEGLATAALVRFLWRERPALLSGRARHSGTAPALPTRRLALAAVVTAGVLSWFASTQPDGLEWSIAHTAGDALASPGDGVHGALAAVQERTTVLPDYALQASKPDGGAGEAPATWPAVDAGTTLAGIVGGVLTLVTVTAIGWALRRRRR